MRLTGGSASPISRDIYDHDGEAYHGEGDQLLPDNKDTARLTGCITQDNGDQWNQNADRDDGECQALSGGKKAANRLCVKDLLSEAFMQVVALRRLLVL